jgi:hypothetical protein
VEWIVDGKRYNAAEFEEYKKQKLEEQKLAQAETWRLINVLGEAYKACSEFMEKHPSSPYGVKDDDQAREHKIYEKLRWNLGVADRAPRCEKVREDGTVCGSPQMKGYRYCYAHERMLQTQSQKLELPALEDANAVQMAIMRVQKALIDDEISEKKAGLLLYSLQMASSNLKHTTFTSKDKKDVVTEMRESLTASGSQTTTSRVIEKQVLPLIHTDDTDKPLLPQIDADKRRSGRKLPKSAEVPKSPELETGKTSPLMSSDHAEAAFSTQHSALSKS